MSEVGQGGKQQGGRNCDTPAGETHYYLHFRAGQCSTCNFGNSQVIDKEMILVWCCNVGKLEQQLFFSGNNHHLIATLRVFILKMLPRKHYREKILGGKDHFQGYFNQKDLKRLGHELELWTYERKRESLKECKPHEDKTVLYFCASLSC